MPKVIATTVYDFDELSDEAKEKAREWYRDGALDYEWWDYIFEDAARIGLEIRSFDLDRRKGCEGRLTMSVEESCKAILAEHGPDCGTTKLAADTLATWNGSDKSDTTEETLTEEYAYALREEYAALLQNEYEYLLSDECVDATIRANEYTFTESGEREG